MARKRTRWDAEAQLPDRLRPRGGEPAPLTELLDRAAQARRGWRTRLEGARVHGLWTEVAGEQLAEHTEPVRLHGGVLVLRAESAAWATQVRYLGAQLAERANTVLGAGQVTQVTVVTGPLKNRAAQDPNKPSDLQ